MRRDGLSSLVGGGGDKADEAEKKNSSLQSESSGEASGSGRKLALDLPEKLVVYRGRGMRLFRVLVRFKGGACGAAVLLLKHPTFLHQNL